MKLKHSGVIFDLDGTLVDTLGDIAASMNRSLALHGFPELPVEEYRGKVGWGIKRLALLCLPDGEREEETAALVAADAAKLYAENPVVHSVIYPEMADIVSALKRLKIKTVVLTNKPDPVAQKVIAGLFPPGAFDCVQGETGHRPRKPDPECVWELLLDFRMTPADFVFAGDSEIDMETALASGCFPLGVSWGYRPKEVILQAGARRVIDDPKELLELF